MDTYTFPDARTIAESIPADVADTYNAYRIGDTLAGRELAGMGVTLALGMLSAEGARFKFYHTLNVIMPDGPVKDEAIMLLITSMADAVGAMSADEIRSRGGY